ncbi:MAG: (d)CMP kinase [Parachlamydiaceae bacterium]|nr:(d)CMP kinase [Parachlamydiaceae bacterium]
MIITIDGPIATGKSSIAKRLAELLGFIYFDTGAMYRCLTYGIMQHNIDVNQPVKLKEFLDTFSFDVTIHHGVKKYIVFDEDVTEKIRGESVTNLVSEISAISLVRTKLVALQRDLSQGINAVFEGRDMGTVVFPNADLKIFLTGRSEVRARRRFEELRHRFPGETQTLTIEKALEDINKRDLYDSTREHSPLQKADDAYPVDTSDLSIDEIVNKILEYVDNLSTQE